MCRVLRAAATAAAPECRTGYGGHRPPGGRWRAGRVSRTMGCVTCRWRWRLRRATR